MVKKHDMSNIWGINEATLSPVGSRQPVSNQGSTASHVLVGTREGETAPGVSEKLTFVALLLGTS